jgi:putative inorganic carbon (hco3(-)) transporter
LAASVLILFRGAAHRFDYSGAVNHGSATQSSQSEGDSPRNLQMLTATLFVLIILFGWVMALARGPFWGLLAYVSIYFNAPNPAINWWAGYLPFDRWSLLSTVVLILSMIIHWKKASHRSLGSARWTIVFFVLSLLITLTLAINQENANQFQYSLFTYCLIAFIIVKTITDETQLRALLLVMVVMAGNLSVNAWLYGKRVHDRLEGIGSADAFGANEFGLLLASILPFLAVLLINGRKHERILCLLATPFILNAFILCNSRGAAVAFVIATGLSAVVFGDKRIRRGLVGMALLSIPVFIMLMDDAYVDRLASLVGGSDAGVYESEEDVNDLSSGRIAIWNYGMEMAADHPLGAGPDGFRDLAHVYMPPDILVEKGDSGYGRRAAHNTYLQVIVEQGIAGLAVFLCMCLSVTLALRRSFKAVQKLDELSPMWRNILFATAVSFLTSLAGGLVTNRVYYEFFWWQIALVVVTASLALDEVARVRQKTGAPDSRAPPVAASMRSLN